MTPLPNDALFISIFGIQVTAHGITAILVAAVLLIAFVYFSGQRFALLMKAIVRFVGKKEAPKKTPEQTKARRKVTQRAQPLGVEGPKAPPRAEPQERDSA
jgi:hypothetical protein